jgi:hypothetical protein
MTIFIYCEKKTRKDALNIISEPDDLRKQIVSAWHKSRIKHCFNNRGSFNKAVRRNRETLKRDGVIKTLFRECNYLFSTKAEDREETLYFKDKATKRTGRLRQQHLKGPLAKIDKEPRTHRFLLTKERFKFVKGRMHKWHDNKGGLPRFHGPEELAENDKYHLEFSREGRKWHKSKGKVKTEKNNLKFRMSSALENILGIRSGKSRVRDENVEVIA